MANLSEKKKAADKRVRPVIRALQELAKDYVKRPGGREKLLQETGLGPTGLNSVLYHGAGTQFTWLNVLLCIFELSPSQIVAALDKKAIRTGHFTDPMDQKWLEVTRRMSLQKRKFWLSLIEFSQTLEN